MNLISHQKKANMYVFQLHGESMIALNGGKVKGSGEAQGEAYGYD